jgi:hypothetical protein
MVGLLVGPPQIGDPRKSVILDFEGCQSQRIVV